MVTGKREQRPLADRAAYALPGTGELLALPEREPSPCAVLLLVRDGFDQADAAHRARTADLRGRRVRHGRLVVRVPRVEVLIGETAASRVVAPTARRLAAEAASPRLTRLIQVVP